MLDVSIIDDSAAIRKILRRVLLRTGLSIGKVLEAGDGVEGLPALGIGEAGQNNNRHIGSKSWIGPVRYQYA
jgi:hypothetical protein